MKDKRAAAPKVMTNSPSKYLPTLSVVNNPIWSAAILGESAGEWWEPAPAGRRPLRSGLVILDPGAGTDGLTARVPAGAGARYCQREGEE